MTLHLKQTRKYLKDRHQAEKKNQKTFIFDPPKYLFMSYRFYFTSLWIRIGRYLILGK